MKMKNTLKKMFPFLIAIFLNFYAIPLLIQDTGGAIVVMMYVMPIIAFVNSIIYGAKQGFHWQYPLAVGILYIPSIFIFYNESAWVYVLSFMLVAVLGNVFGMFLSWSRKKR